MAGGRWQAISRRDRCGQTSEGEDKSASPVNEQDQDQVVGGLREGEGTAVAATCAR